MVVFVFAVSHEKEKNMKITVLIDNRTITDLYFQGEPALSLHIEHNNKKILFDTGYSDLFIKNAEKLKIDLKGLDYVVLSHGHDDHSWGIPLLIKHMTEGSEENATKPVFVAHPDSLAPKRIDNHQVGATVSAAAMEAAFDMRLTEEPFWLDESAVFLGRIPRENPFEGQEPMGETFTQGAWREDHLMDDSALAFKLQEGLIIVTGCSHAGICNIVDHAIKVTGEQRILDIIGGFHLEKVGENQMQGTMKRLSEVNPAQVHPCHCTGFNAQLAMVEAKMNVKEVGVGLKISYPG